MRRHPSLDAEYPDGRSPLGGSRVRIAAWEEASELTLVPRTVTRLEELGIKVPPTSRLLQAKSSLERARQFHVELGPGDPETEEWLAEAKRTIAEMFIITMALSNRASEIGHKLREMLGGPPVPEDGAQDKARDVQAELLVAAALSAGGYWVNFAEPDLVIPDLMGIRTGVAIKRVSSKREDQIQKRLRQARNQLRSNNIPGMIVVNSERYLANLYRANRGIDLSKALYIKITEWLDYIHQRDDSLYVRCVAGIATSIRLDRYRQSFNLHLHFHPKFIIGHESETEALHGHLKDLSERIAVGLQRLMNFSL